MAAYGPYIMDAESDSSKPGSGMSLPTSKPEVNGQATASQNGNNYQVSVISHGDSGPQVPEASTPNGQMDNPRMESHQMGKRKIIKNLLVVSLGFLFVFTAYQSSSNLQTSLHKEGGVGHWSQSAIYISLILSCMFLPNFIISRLGCKWTIPLSMIGFIIYMGANFYAIIATMVPAGILLGLGAAPLWSAKCTYVTQIAQWYARQTGKDSHDVVNAFFGVFFLFFQSSQIWGNLVSSLVFSPPDDDNSTTVPLCGNDYCPWNPGNDEANFEQDEKKVYIVFGTFLGLAVLAALSVSIFLDPITLDKDVNNENRQESSTAGGIFLLLIATWRHLFSSLNQVLLIPYTIYSGVEQQFVTGEITKAYVSCALGVWTVGYVMICYGVTGAICCLIFGRIVQWVGHIPLFVFAFLVHAALQITLLIWTPHADQEVLFFVIAAIWAMGDAVVQTQLNALYGNLFSDKTEAAFANYRMWESLGFAVTFGYNDALCTETKLIICLVVLCVGMAGYTAVEVRTWRARRNTLEITSVAELKHGRGQGYSTFEASSERANGHI